MPDPLTTNKSLVQPPNASHPGTWDQPVNNNSGALDTILGGVTTLNATGPGGTVTLALANYQAVNIVVTGTLTGPITYLLPANVGGFYFVQNKATGGTVSFGSASAAGVVTVPTGDGAAIVIDPVYGARLGDSIAADAAGGAGQVQYNDPATGNFAGAPGIVYTPATQGVALGGPLSVAGATSLNGPVVTPLVVNGGGASTLPVALTYAAAIALDCSKSNVFTLALLGNVTSVAISGQNDGQTINWRLTQNSPTGGQTIAWPANFKWPGGSAPVLSTAAGAVDLLVATYFASAGGWLANLIKGFA